MRWVGVVVVHPHTTRLDRSRHLVEFMCIPRPNAGTQPVGGIVRDGDGLFRVLEGGHGQHWSEDLFLEDAHLVVALEHGGLDVIPRGEVALQLRRSTTREHLGTFLLADIDVAEDLLVLVIAGLCAKHGSTIQRTAELHGFHARDHTLHELVVDALVYQQTRRAGADLTLVQAEHHRSFDSFVEERIVSVHHGREEDVRALATQFHGHRVQVLAGVLHDQAARGGFTGEGHLGDARRLR